MQAAHDAIVIGAGPAGSAAAIRLAQAGWSVALVEKQPFPRRKVCGECIAASNFALLHALGIGPALEEAAGPALREVALMRGDRQVVAALPQHTDARFPWGRALGREVLDTLLLERARAVGVTIYQPWAVVAANGSPGDWRCLLRAQGAAASDAAENGADANSNGSAHASHQGDADARPRPNVNAVPPASRRTNGLRLNAPVLIAANGSWELLPSERPARRGARRASDLLAFKANFSGAALREGLLPVLCFPGGYGGMVVADGGVMTLACCVRADHLEAARRQHAGGRAGEAVEALLSRECRGVRDALWGATREGPWLAAGPLDPGMRLGVFTGTADGMLRIGNAAGEVHPIIGEGMSMALQSAWLLSDELLRAERREQLADREWQTQLERRYAAQWRRHFGARLALATAFAHTAMRPVPSAALMALARAWPGLLPLGARSGGKTTCPITPDPQPTRAGWTAAAAPASPPHPLAEPHSGGAPGAAEQPSPAPLQSTHSAGATR